MRRTVTLLTVAGVMTVAMAGRVGFAQSGQSEYRNVDAQLMRKFRDANAYCEKAKICFGKKDIAGTRKELNASLALIPEFAEARLLMAKVLYTEKDYEKALTEVMLAKTGFEKSLTLLERMQQDRMNELRKRREEKENSLADLRGQLSKVAADQRQAVQGQITKVESDKDDIDRILNAPPPKPNQIPAEYFFFHGNILLRMQKHAEAVVQYDEALKINPAYGEAANNLASLYYSARQYEKALAVITKAEANGAVTNPELKKAVESALQKPKEPK